MRLMDIILIVLLALGAAAAIVAMILSRRKGRCASCPYYDNCPRLNCKEKGDEEK